MKVMAIEAHPDDIEHLSAGTLAKYRAAGHEVAIVVMTNGELASETLSKEEIAKVREQETRDAAKLIDAEVFWMGYPDAFLFNTPEVRLALINTIRKFDPDVIITLDKDNDYHPDHVATGQIVWDTRILLTIGNIETESPVCTKIPQMYYMDTPAGLNFSPEFYVDVSEQWATKEAMVLCHVSQEKWCQEQYNTSLTSHTELHTRFRGYQAGCKYAEGFRRVRTYPQIVGEKDLLP